VSRGPSTPTAVEVPFNQPYTSGAELEYIREAIAGAHLSGNGPFTQKCSAWLEDALGSPRALLTHSCTGALEMATLLAEIGPGDEVIMPSFTFTSTATAVTLRGGTPVFVDIREDTLNIDEKRVADAVTARTRAIMPVHYAGIACAMDELLELAEARGLAIIEDAAHALGSALAGRPLGAIGAFGALSFHETKNVISGEGGALLVNDPAFIDRAEILLEKGTNRRAFFRGEVDKYTWVDLGSSYLPADLLAAFLCGQLERRDSVQARRRDIWEYYALRLRAWADQQHVRLPSMPSHCDQPYHMFYLIMPTADARTRVIEHLRQRGILSVFHYVPLHLSAMGERFGGAPGDCPIAEDISARLVRLPFYNNLSADDQAYVCDVIEEVHCI
jgi:dTDP-4-amino-4,6-dideoxygalactose transaminase